MIFLALFFSIRPLLTPAEPVEERTYLATDHDRKTTIRYVRETQSHGSTIRLTHDNGGAPVLEEFWLDDRGDTIRWHLIAEGTRSDVTAERQGRKVLLKGSRKGKRVDKVFELDEHPWNQLFGFGIEPHVRTGSSEKTLFWAIGTKGPGDMEWARFRAELRRRVAAGGITQGEPLSVWRITFTSWLSVFWWGEYFYPSDGRLQRSEDKGGSRLELCREPAGCGK